MQPNTTDTARSPNILLLKQYHPWAPCGDYASDPKILTSSSAGGDPPGCKGGGPLDPVAYHVLFPCMLDRSYPTERLLLCVCVYEGVLCGGGYGGGCLCASIYMSARSAMLSMSPLD